MTYNKRFEIDHISCNKHYGWIKFIITRSCRECHTDSLHFFIGASSNWCN